MVPGSHDASHDVPKGGRRPRPGGTSLSPRLFWYYWYEGDVERVGADTRPFYVSCLCLEIVHAGRVRAEGLFKSPRYHTNCVILAFLQPDQADVVADGRLQRHVDNA